MDGALYASTYIRMEFIRRWVCDLIRMAMIARQCTAMSEAWHYLAQDFSGRNLKTGYFAMGTTWETLRRAREPLELAEELAHLAVSILKKFDKVFKALIKNSSGCQIGGKQLKPDGDSMFEDLHAFYVDFNEPIQDCKINSFLKLENPHGDAHKVLNDSRACEGDAAARLKEYRDVRRWITCDECKAIGDVVVALELSGSWSLVHGDKKSFPALCAALGKHQVYVASVQSLQHVQRNWSWTLQGKPPAVPGT